MAQIIGAPIFFSTVWGWIKRWFDPVTVSKIFILSHHEVLPVLTSFIDTKNIPKQYGGELDFVWCQMPNLDPKIKELATWENGFTEFPKGPLRWVSTEGGKKMEAFARGTVDKKERNTRVCTIPVAFSEEAAPAVEVLPGEAADTAVVAPPVEALAGEAADTAVVVDVPTDEEFKDVPESPIKSPAIADIQGVQNLSLSEKTAEVESVPNGKAEAA